MKERPILMTPENGQRCFEGVKTQTRRMNGLEEINENPSSWACTVLERGEAVFVLRPYSPRGHRQIKCLYGVPGDRLWIREACWIWGSWQQDKVGKWHFIEHATSRARKLVTFHKQDRFNVKKGDAAVGWVRRPGIFMPRWACRTVVEITEIRVQRVQEISDDDKIAEGMDTDTCLRGRHDQWVALWNSINGAGAWERNDWVWCLSFRKI